MYLGCNIRRVWTKVVIRSGISKKNKQHYGQKKKYKSTNNDLQNIHIILKNPTKTRGELGCSGRVGSCFSTSGPRYVTLVTPGDKSRMRKGHGSTYDKWNISVVICDPHIPYDSHTFLNYLYRKWIVHLVDALVY